MKSLLAVAVFVLVTWSSGVVSSNPKPGKCPPPSSNCTGPQPTKGCQSDGECPGTYKCCGNCCKRPVSVTCRYIDVDKKVYVGECKLPQYCNKKQFACPAIKCNAPWEDCICCFKKKKVAPPKDFCNPPPIKPGKCPARPTDAQGITFAPPCVGSTTCSTDDRDCPLNQKCCDGCCRNPVRVTCRYIDADGKTFTGECKLPSMCGKGEKACEGIKCSAPWDNCVCCFKKKEAPSKQVCKNGPPPPVTTCTIFLDDGPSWTGQCVKAEDCKAPNKLRFPCSTFTKCPADSVCCFKKKGKPPAKYCNP